VLGTRRSKALAILTAQAQRGFTLIEIAIVLVVIGLITSGGLLAVSPVIQSAKISETKQKMATVEAAILGYVIQNGCLPCPARRDIGGSPTGVANSSGVLAGDYTTACGSGGTCLGGTSVSGLVPWVSLGISQNDITDGWDRMFTYSVDTELTDSSIDVQRTASGAFPALSVPLIVIQASTGTTPLGYASIAYSLVSHGQDGAYGETIRATTVAASGAPANEGQNENGDDDLTFATGLVNATQGATYFDDIVVFKSLQPLILSCGSGSCGNPS
jgi:prepilin-type N-terminal cleavage/methylation domain-containing protein